MDFLVSILTGQYSLDSLIQWGGYILLVAIVFAETGLLIGCFLPGDSLLVTAGLLAAAGHLNIWWINALHMAAAIMGLAALLHTSALAFHTLKYLGVAYLLYMAWAALRERGALRIEPQTGARSAVQVIVAAILLNILNPKLSIFFLAFLPQFVDAAEPQPLARMLTLSAVFMLMTFVVFVGYGLFAASIRSHVISRPRVLTWMRRTFAAAFVALGARLALADR